MESGARDGEMGGAMERRVWPGDAGEMERGARDGEMGGAMERGTCGRRWRRGVRVAGRCDRDGRMAA